MQKVDQAICSRLKESIADERSASPMYRNLKELLKDNGLLSLSDESKLDSIIKDEMDHEDYFINLAKGIGCEISTKRKTEERYYKKPLSERIELAKKIVAGMGSYE